MILLLFYSINCYTANNSQSFSYRGFKNDSVIVSLDAIKLANIKLINYEAEKALNKQLNNIINNREQQIILLNKEIEFRNNKLIELEIKINTALTENNKLKKDNIKIKQQRNVLSVTGTVLGIIIGLLL